MIRFIVSFLTLIVVGGIIAGSFFGVRYLQEQQFHESNSKVAWVELEEIHITMTRDTEVQEIRTYGIVLETREGNPYKLVVEQRPRLKDKFMVYMAALATRAGPENLDNLPYVKRQLLYGAEEVLGPRAVIDISFKVMTSRTPES